MAKIEPESVNLILTDPPYGKAFLKEIAELGAFASRVLVDGGLLVLYYGQFWPHRLQEMLEPEMTYRWTIASVWEGDGNPVYIRGESSSRVINHWNPIFVFSKGEWKRDYPFNDVSYVTSKEKQYHDWQQPIDQIEGLIQTFSDPGDLVLDPCGGSMTTAVACRRLNRRCIACDKDRACVLRGQERLFAQTK